MSELMDLPIRLALHLLRRDSLARVARRQVAGRVAVAASLLALIARMVLAAEWEVAAMAEAAATMPVVLLAGFLVAVVVA